MDTLTALSQILNMGGSGAMIIIAVVLFKQDKRITYLEYMNIGKSK